jgi:hypothetical protein
MHHETLPANYAPLRITQRKKPGRKTLARVSVLFALSVPLLPSVAATYIPTLNGDQFISMMSKPAPLSGPDYLEREKAYSYLDGARDSAEGSVWCDANQLKTHDLAQDLAHDIAKLPPAQRKRSASALLLDQLKRKYPCQKGGRA